MRVCSRARRPCARLLARVTKRYASVRAEGDSRHAMSWRPKVLQPCVGGGGLAIMRRGAQATINALDPHRRLETWNNHGRGRNASRLENKLRSLSVEDVSTGPRHSA